MGRSTVWPAAAVVIAIVVAGDQARTSAEPLRALPVESGAPKESECVFCISFSRYAAALERATREVGALPNGVVIHLRCDHPETVLELQRYAFEKQKLREQYWARPKGVPVCETCHRLLKKIKGAHFVVANSVHGVFTIITSSDPEVVRALHHLASEETKDKSVRGS